MEAVQVLERFLYTVSSGLYLPVIAIVSMLCLYTLWLLGTLAADALLRHKGGSPELEAYRQRLAAELARPDDHVDARLERMLQAAELSASRRLDRVRFVIKVGPALGLMGTLIPMGVSLASLAEGNVPKMAGSMVTAFTATVVGLACGVVAYLIALVRENWARAEIREMEFITEIGARNGAPPVAEPTQAEEIDALSATPTAV
ncbi:membrane protein [Methylosinus sp. C49]|uniref:MotA/TolQ/ExbB proton channel family protein n=1 Tax=Methylosinus sp. C49 TaxID=2699395 RepID=UPI001366CD18|nr:MotA/TolQ/ExbB proton channel family protein [Methylosinus sp. C49]BBU63711.1 membrane protein [Methylosinus sp. C49]